MKQVDWAPDHPPVYLQHDIHTRLKILAARRGISLKSLVREAIEEWLTKQGEEVAYDKKSLGSRQEKDRINSKESATE